MTRLSLFSLLCGLMAGVLCSACTEATSPPGLESRPAVASVAFETERNQILLPVRIGEGAEIHWFMLDSAVDPSVIDLSLLGSDGVSLIDDAVAQAEGAGEGAGLEIRQARLARYRLGDEVFTDLDAVAADLSGFGEALGRPLAGILGYSFLKDRVVRIDYARRSVEVAETSSALESDAAPTARQLVVPLRFLSDEDLIPVIDVEINGETLRMSLDTGSSLGLQIYDSAVDRLALGPLRDEAAESSVQGARGTAAIRNATLDGVRIGPFMEDDVAVSFSTRGHDPAQRQGNIGNQFLDRFTLTLDYVDGVVVFAQ